LEGISNYRSPNIKERNHLVDLSIGEWTILKWFLEKEVMDLILLDQNRIQLQAFVNTLMNLNVP